MELCREVGKSFEAWKNLGVRLSNDEIKVG
jgi:hypothetical protein